MTRLEIISNNTIEVDIIEALTAVNRDLNYSKISSVHGKGNSSPKNGDAIWPEENFIFIIYCSDDLAEQYITAISVVKNNFRQEGLKVFTVPCLERNI